MERRQRARLSWWGQVTWENAPPIAQEMTLSPTEFASLFREGEQPHVTCSGPSEGAWDRKESGAATSPGGSSGSYRLDAASARALVERIIAEAGWRATPSRATHPREIARQ